MKLSVCIPMYNEGKIIENNARALSAYLRSNFPDSELIYIDDGSTDGCGDLVRGLGLPNCRVIGYQPNRGKGCAVRTGMLAASGDICLFTDADLAYGTEVIGEAVKVFAVHPDADLVIGSRKLAGDGYAGYTAARKLASKIYLWLLQRLGGFRLSDSQTGFKCFTGKAAKQIFSLCETDRFAFDFEALCYATRLGMKIEEIPVRILNHGESKIHLVGDSLRMFRDILKIRHRVNRKVKELRKNA